MRPVWLDSVAAAVLEATQAPELDALKGELLRQWSSSEVWRLSYGLRSVIAKRASGAQSGEAEVYERLVVPLGLPAPELIQAARADDAVLLVLADAGRGNLEQEPTAEGFLAAAELLAAMRSKPVEGPSGFTSTRLVELADRIEPMDPARRDRLVAKGAPALDDLHRDAPPAVIHGDFVPKNLVTDGARWTVVDWPLSYCAPHLGDLYTLVRDAVAYGHQSAPVVARYIEASGADRDLVGRQLTVGGICFVTIALSWIVEEGHRIVPSSNDWIAPLLAELGQLTDDLPQ